MPDGLARAAAAVQLSCRLAFFLCLCRPTRALRQTRTAAAAAEDSWAAAAASRLSGIFLPYTLQLHGRRRRSLPPQCPLPWGSRSQAWRRRSSRGRTRAAAELAGSTAGRGLPLPMASPHRPTEKTRAAAELTRLGGGGSMGHRRRDG